MHLLWAFFFFLIFVLFLQRFLAPTLRTLHRAVTPALGSSGTACLGRYICPDTHAYKQNLQKKKKRKKERKEGRKKGRKEERKKGKGKKKKEKSLGAAVFAFIGALKRQKQANL